MTMEESLKLIQAPIHTRAVFDPTLFPHIVQWIVETIKRERYDAIAVSGHSGLVVAGAVAYILQIPVIAVRKKGDGAMGDDRRVNAILTKEHTVYAFVDDLIGGGTTLRNVVDRVQEMFSKATECGGIVLYNANKEMARSALDCMDFSAPRPFYSMLPVFVRPKGPHE